MFGFGVWLPGVVELPDMLLPEPDDVPDDVPEEVPDVVPELPVLLVPVPVVDELPVPVPVSVPVEVEEPVVPVALVPVSVELPVEVDWASALALSAVEAMNARSRLVFIVVLLFGGAIGRSRKTKALRRGSP